jgi:signal transduction histidine kinase
MALRELSPGQSGELLSMMLDDLERLTTLIDRILGAARIERQKGNYHLEPVSMRHFLEEMLNEDRHLFEKDGHSVILEKGGDARAALDRSAMRMAVSNLIENAVRYSPRGSAIRVRLHRDLRRCRLDVIDSGAGIARKDLKNVFKMFWRGEGSLATGTGLGLHIVRHIVRDHKGKVWASSPGPGRGSTFSISLPRVRRYWGIAATREPRHSVESRA